MVLIVVFGAAQASAVVVYSNPYDPNSTVAYSSWFATDGYGLWHQSFADYVWEDPFYMTDFHWWGMGWGGPEDIEGFTFQVWSHGAAADLPGGILYEEYFSGNAGATFVESNYGGDVYKYGVDLSTAYRPSSPGHYWFSVIAHSTQNWFWGKTSGITFGDDLQHAYVQSDDYWQNVHDFEEADFAYEITTGDPIPEPATMILVGLGLLGMAARRKLKK